jgi:single-stranded DNA-binding protein
VIGRVRAGSREALIFGRPVGLQGSRASSAVSIRSDVELRRSASGKEWCRLSVDVGEGDALTWVSVSVFEEKARELAGLAKGAEVYVEGCLSLNAWTGKDGQQRTGLSVTAWQLMPLGQIGRRKPKVQSRDEYERPRNEQDAVPFDDPLRF